MTIEYIRSVNDTFHTAIYNYENKFCHWVSIIQRLHTSKTLNEICHRMSEREINSDVYHLLLKPVKIYSNLVVDQNNDSPNSGNILSIYSQFDQYFNEFIPQYVHPSARNGYTPHFLTLFLYAPIIFHLFPDKFLRILTEIHVDRTLFNVSPSVAENNITTKHPFLMESSHQQQVVKDWNAMMEYMTNIQTIELNPFCSTTLEIFPNKDMTGGHAVTLISGYSNLEPSIKDYFVIDDQNTISKFCDYYNSHNQKLFEISMRDIDDAMINEFNKMLHEKCDMENTCKFSARITRYVLSLEQNFLSPNDEILKPILRQEAEVKPKTKEQKESNERLGITTRETQKEIIEVSVPAFVSYKQLFKWLLIGVIIGVILDHLIGTKIVNGLKTIFIPNIFKGSSNNSI